MQTLLPLALCLLFVLLLLRLTGKGAQGRSRALWIPTFWVLISASRPVGKWLYPGGAFSEASLISGSLPDQIVLGAFILLALGIISRRRIHWRSILRENRWLLVLVAYMALSAFWSDYTMISLKRWARVIGTVLCALVVMSERQPLLALELVLRRVAYVLIPLSVVLIRYFPAYGIEFSRWGGNRMPRGVCLQKNGLGLLCALSALLLIWSLLRKNRLKLLGLDRAGSIADVSVILLAFYLLKGADTNIYSATAIGILAIALFLLFLLWSVRAHPQYGSRLIIFLAVVVGLAFLVGELSPSLSPLKSWTRLLGRNETLTDRVLIWADVFKIAPRFSLFGAGYGGFWGLPYTYLIIDEMTGHNGYLDVYVELGLVGILLLGVFLLRLWQRLGELGRQDYDWSVLGLCLLITSLAYNYTETDYLTVSSPLWASLIFLSFALAGETAQRPVFAAEAPAWPGAGELGV